MSKKKLKNLSDLGVHIFDDHKIPSNRRDFLASGIMGLSTMALVPTVLLNSPKLMAQQCSNIADCGVPFLSFEGAGGMNIAGGNAMVGMDPDQSQVNFGAGMSMTDYIRLGLSAEQHPSKPGMLNTTYGLVYHSTSGLLAGLQEMLTPATATDPDYRKSMDGIIICARSGDDSNSNPINAAFQANRAGSHGQLIQLIGGTNSDTGARSPAVSTQIKSELRSSRITQFTEASGLLSLGSSIMNNSFLDAANTGGTARVKGFLNKIINLSQNRLDTFVNQQQNMQALMNAQQGTKELFDQFSPASLNPVNNPAQLGQLQAAFGGTGSDVDDEDIASVASLVTNRIAGVGSFTVGGCDYHNGSASSGQNKDKQIGRYIGKCVKLAALKGQNLFIHLYTDGGVGGATGGTIDTSPEGAERVIWTNDSGTRSAQLCLVYKHGHDRDINGALILDNNQGNQKTRQIGYFNKAGGINTSSSSVAASTEQIWKAVILNYMACMSTAVGDQAVVADVVLKWNTIFPTETSLDDAAEIIRFKSLVA
ncbi:MAG: hypothetical protein HN576_06545 [Bacteriovoracaceae bacterium]|jgi:hypothetical protein|nr:hypothetical protein [Bacteriovoracaceae bacterium]